MATEPAIVVSIRGSAAAALRLQQVTSSVQMADYLKSVSVVNSPEECQAIVDAAKACKVGLDELKSQLESITRPLRDADKAARMLAKPQMDALAAAIAHAKTLYDNWDRRAKAEAERQRAEAERLEREAAEKRAAEAAALREAGMQDVEEAAPEASSYTPPAETIVRGGTGSMYKTVRKKYRVTNLLAAIQAHPELFDVKLRQTDAKDALATLRRVDPDARLTGIEEYDEESSSLV